MTDMLDDIERRRREFGVSVRRLERTAGLSHGSYARMLKRGGARLSTLARLSHALKRAARTGEERERSVELIFRLAVAAASLEAGEDAALVFQHDPARRATSDPEWSRAANIRRRALYLANVCAGLNQAELARAAGMTKQAVSLAMPEIEDSRGDPAVEKFFTHFERAISG